MACTFTLRLDLTDHEHPGNQAAQHALVLQMLDLAKQAIGSDVKRSGDLIYAASFQQKKIGSWQFSDQRQFEQFKPSASVR